MAEHIVLDAHAVLVFLGREPGWEQVAEILSFGSPWMTLVNLGEAAYILQRNHGTAAVDEMWANFRAEQRPEGVPIQWLEIGDALVRRAAALKAIGGLSYADAFAAGAAALIGCPVLTGDPEFRSVEPAGIRVKWLAGHA